MKKQVSMWFLAAISVLLVVSVSQPMLAQETTAQITGTIFDAQGAAVTGAEITVIASSTGFRRTTSSTGSGTYSLPLLPPGSYNLTVKAKGFATLQQKNLSLAVGQVLTLNQSLRPGGATEVVEVAGTPPLVETSRTEIGGSVSPPRGDLAPYSGSQHYRIDDAGSRRPASGGLRSDKNAGWKRQH